MSWTCSELLQNLDWWLDNELDDTRCQEFEEHVRFCLACRQIVQRKQSLRQTLQDALVRAVAPQALREHLRLATQREERQRFGVRRWLPPAAAAAVLFGFVAQQVSLGSGRELDEVTARHVGNLPMDMMAADTGQLERYLATQLPFMFQVPRMETEPQSMGARITQINRRDAAHLRYRMPRGSVSVFVYEDPDRNEPEVAPLYRLGHQKVQFRRVHGYTTAQWRNGSLVYSVVSELPESELTRTMLWR